MNSDVCAGHGAKRVRCKSRPPVYAEPKSKPPRESQGTPTEEKESAKWRYGMDQARQILSETAGDQPTPRLIHVMDREIEEFHLVLKSGCQIEKLRLKTWERLEKAVRVNSAVAARIVWLREVARHAGGPS